MGDLVQLICQVCFVCRQIDEAKTGKWFVEHVFESVAVTRKALELTKLVMSYG